MIRTQISMTAEQAERLRRLAEVRERSQAALLRDALDDYLGRDSRFSGVARARAAVGAFAAEPGDASVRHDEALDDAFSP